MPSLIPAYALFFPSPYKTLQSTCPPLWAVLSDNRLNKECSQHLWSTQRQIFTQFKKGEAGRSHRFRCRAVCVSVCMCVCFHFGSGLTSLQRDSSCFRQTAGKHGERISTKFVCVCACQANVKRAVTYRCPVTIGRLRSDKHIGTHTHWHPCGPTYTDAKTWKDNTSQCQ